MGSKLTRGMDVFVCLFRVHFILCVGSSLAPGSSPMEGVLLTVYTSGISTQRASVASYS
jgi:hypothetical protein